MSIYDDGGDDGVRDYYSEMLEDMAISDDQYASELLFVGWFDTDADIDERAEARDLFFEYMDMDNADFDWDTWREYYGEAA